MLGSLPICYLSVKDQDATGQHISGTESGRGAPSRAALEGKQQWVVGLSLQRQLAGHRALVTDQAVGWSLQPLYFLGGNQKCAEGVTWCHRILRCSSYIDNKFSRETTLGSCLLPFCRPGMRQFCSGWAQAASLVLRKSRDTQSFPLGPKTWLAAALREDLSTAGGSDSTEDTCHSSATAISGTFIESVRSQG